MSVLFVDGFDHYAPDDVLKKWTSLTEEMTTGQLSMTTGRFEGQALSFNLAGTTTASSAISKDINPTSNEIYLGAAVKYTSNIGGSEEGLIFIVYDSAGTAIASVYIDQTGKLNAQRGVPVTPSPLGSSTTSLTQTAWYYVELKYIPSNTAGTMEVKINGTTEINVTGTDTTAGLEDIGAFGLGSYRGSGIGLSFDDLYVVDTAGTKNNSFLGDVTVYTEVPTADTVEADFTPLSGTDHFAMVDDATDIDDDTTYVENGSIAATDRYTSAALGVTGTVHCVQVNTVARKSDSEIRKFVTSIKSGTTEKEDTTEFNVGASYLDYTQIYEDDPNTATSWTVSGVDAMEFGFKVTV